MAESAPGCIAARLHARIADASICIMQPETLIPVFLAAPPYVLPLPKPKVLPKLSGSTAPTIQRVGSGDPRWKCSPPDRGGKERKRIR